MTPSHRTAITPGACFQALLGGLLALAAAGCAVGPRYRAPATALTPTVAAPAYASADAALATAPATDRWWKVLGDPLLDELIDSGLADNPDLAGAEARVQQSRALARVAGAQFLPSVNASGRISRDQLSRNGENLALIPFTPATTRFTDYRVGVDASWEIDLFGKTRREVEAAVARLGSSEESRNDARLVVATAVADAYVDYRANAARVALAERNRASLEETLHLVVLTEQAGLVSQADLHRTEAELLATAGAVPPLEAARQAALFQLAWLTGQSGESLAARLAAPATLPQAPASVAVGLPADLLRRRPDIRRAERELAAATADVGEAVAAQFPRLSLVGDLGMDSVHPGELTSAASRYWNLGPQLTLPLFAGGRLHGQARAAESARDAALASYRSAVLRAISDAETGIARYAAQQRREASLAASTATLAQALDLERRRQAAGDASMLDVQAAERAANQAADQQAAGQAELLRAYVALGKALGGGWQGAPAAAPAAIN